MMCPTPFTEVVHVANAQAPDDQAPRANAGDMMVDSLEKRLQKKFRDLAVKLLLSERREMVSQKLRETTPCCP